MIGQTEPIIDVRHVFKTFPSGDTEITVLRGVSLTVQRGEFVAIVGPSGNGKSTLLNMITGIDHPTQGQVIVNGRAVHKMNENQLAAWRNTDVGIVFQFFQLLPSLNLLQNVMLPMDFARRLKPKDRREQAHCLLELVGLKDQWHKLPSQISGGQQQRAAIARALANQPPLIVADEPTGNLDARTSDEIFSLFCRLTGQGTTLVMVTHNEELARQAPRTVSVVNGLIESDVMRAVTKDCYSTSEDTETSEIDGEAQEQPRAAAVFRAIDASSLPIDVTSHNADSSFRPNAASTQPIDAATQPIGASSQPIDPSSRPVDAATQASASPSLSEVSVSSAPDGGPGRP